MELRLLGFTVPIPANRSLIGRRSDKTNKHLSVCVQLPIYNEGAVVERLLESIAELEYPPGLLEIQVLDDSTDPSRFRTAAKVESLRGVGVPVSLITRQERIGFKAGALREGLLRTEAELIAVFDADFVPPKDFLLRTVPHFADQKIGLVQARWGHLNREQNLLTRGEGLLIDGHFMVEHAARYRCGGFFNFNGTAGVWRREAIEEAGGWQADTLTEDLDLSYRAQLCGWKFIYERDIVCPAELPDTISGFKSQQYRWTKGSAQVFRKLIWRIMRSDITRRQKVESFLHLSGNFCYIYATVAALLFIPVGIWRAQHGFFLGAWVELGICITTFSSMITFYRYAAGSQGINLRIMDLLSALTLGIGMAAHCAGAAISGLLSNQTGEFVRTPKRGETVRLKSQCSMRELIRSNIKEIVISLYLIGGMLYISALKDLFFAPFGLLPLSGYLRVAIAGIHQDRLLPS